MTKHKKYVRKVEQEIKAEIQRIQAVHGAKKYVLNLCVSIAPQDIDTILSGVDNFQKNNTGIHSCSVGAISNMQVVCSALCEPSKDCLAFPCVQPRVRDETLMLLHLHSEELCMRRAEMMHLPAVLKGAFKDTQ